MTQDGFWLFAYGSLMARPALPWTERVEASLLGYRRRFWQGSHDHQEVPGARDACDPGAFGGRTRGSRKAHAKGCSIFYHRRWPRAPSLASTIGKRMDTSAALGRCGTALGSAAEPWSILRPRTILPGSAPPQGGAGGPAVHGPRALGAQHRLSARFIAPFASCTSRTPTLRP